MGNSNSKKTEIAPTAPEDTELTLNDPELGFHPSYLSSIDPNIYFNPLPPSYEEIDTRLETSIHATFTLSVRCNTPVTERILSLCLPLFNNENIGLAGWAPLLKVLIASCITKLQRVSSGSSFLRYHSTVSKTIRYNLRCSSSLPEPYIYMNTYNWDIDDFSSEWQIKMILKPSKLRGHKVIDLLSATEVRILKDLLKVNFEKMENENDILFYC